MSTSYVKLLSALLIGLVLVGDQLSLKQRRIDLRDIRVQIKLLIVLLEN